MYKILIADDEPIIHTGLKNAIDWKQEGCMIIDCAFDGFDALEKIKKTEPNIVISDIRMPEIDGIELLEKVSIFNPRIKFILLTGHKEFEYAKKALQLGAFDYLLKPTDIDNLLEVIRKAIKALEIDLKREEEFNRIKMQIDESIPVLKENFLRTILTYSVHDEEFFQMNEKMELYKLQFDTYHVLILQIDYYYSYLSRIKEFDSVIHKLAIRTICEREMTGCRCGCFIEIECNRFAMLLGTEMSDVESKRKLEKIAESVQERVMELLDISISIGISDEATNLCEAHCLFNQAVEALKYRFYLGNAAVIHYSDCRSEGQISDPGYNRYYQRIVELVKVGDTTNTLAEISILFDKYSRNNCGIESIRNSAVELLAAVHSAFSANYLVSCNEKWKNVYMRLFQCETIKDMNSLILNLIENLSDSIYKQRNNHNRQIINEIIKYMQNNYNKNLSLEDIAGVVYMNPSYISRLIKKECNEKFSDLMIKFRMNKAKELLRNSNLKVYEVADAVGMSDAKYFALAFKKVTGMTPTDFRENMKDILSE